MADYRTDFRALTGNLATTEQKKDLNQARGFAARLAQLGYAQGYRNYYDIPALLEFWDEVYVKQQMAYAYKIIHTVSDVLDHHGKVPKKYRL